MGAFDKLLEYFSKFPGIGARQAKRFVYHLLAKDNAYVKNLADTIINLKKEMAVCPDCFRNFQKSPAKKCKICADENRDHNSLLIVASDVDLDVIEKSGSYKGYYFIIDSLIPILDKEPAKKIRLTELRKTVEKRTGKGLKEIIIALNANPEGENTTDFIRESLAETVAKKNIKISILGRGLSSGTEVEYSDPDTIKNALHGRI